MPKPCSSQDPISQGLSHRHTNLNQDPYTKLQDDRKAMQDSDTHHSTILFRCYIEQAKLRHKSELQTIVKFATRD